jgi:hypothetical protein
MAWLRHRDLSDALEGPAPTRLATPASEVTLMAMCVTDGAWHYRKAVWSFESMGAPESRRHAVPSRGSSIDN